MSMTHAGQLVSDGGDMMMSSKECFDKMFLFSGCQTSCVVWYQSSMHELC